MAVFVSHPLADLGGFELHVGRAAFLLLFCGCSIALWMLGLRPEVLALPIAFLAAFFCFTPDALQRLSSADWPRVALVLGLLLAPILMVWRTAESQPAWRSTYLPTLDGWRAIAITLVMIDHAVRAAYDRRGAVPPALFCQGQIGVNIFFAISGLLITWKLLEERQETGGISLPHFYRRRVLRIFPAALAFLTAIGCLAVAGWLPATRLEFVSTALFFRNWVPVLSPCFSTAHFWSLSLEEQFYLVLPAALLLFGMRLRWASAALAVCCAIWRWYFFHFTAAPDVIASTRYRTDLRLDGLLCGCLMAFALQDARVRSRLQRMLSTRALALLVAAFAGLAYWADGHTLMSESVILPLLLAGTMLSPNEFPVRILESKPLRWIGRISYSLYLWQQLFLLCPLRPPALHVLNGFPVSVIATFACAGLSYYRLERPLLRRAHRPLSPRGKMESLSARAATAATA